MNIVTVEIKLKTPPTCTVYAFDFWMRFQSYTKYLDWMDSTDQARFQLYGGD